MSNLRPGMLILFSCLAGAAGIAYHGVSSGSAAAPPAQTQPPALSPTPRPTRATATPTRLPRWRHPPQAQRQPSASRSTKCDAFGAQALPNPGGVHRQNPLRRYRWPIRRHRPATPATPKRADRDAVVTCSQLHSAARQPHLLRLRGTSLRRRCRRRGRLRSTPISREQASSAAHPLDRRALCPAQHIAASNKPRTIHTISALSRAALET